MDLRFEKIGESDIETLATWMSSEIWPFHGRPRVDPDWVRARAADGDFFGPAATSFWIIGAPGGPAPTSGAGPASASGAGPALASGAGPALASDAGPASARLGIVRAFDLPDVTPLVDLRIAAVARGQRVGTAALLWITRHVFVTFAETVRLGGYTRHDNLPMMRVFEKCGYVCEAYHRRSWPVDGAELADSVGYSILRTDWMSGTTTPMPWP